MFTVLHWTALVTSFSDEIVPTHFLDSVARGAALAKLKSETRARNVNMVMQVGCLNDWSITASTHPFMRPFEGPGDPVETPSNHGGGAAVNGYSTWIFHFRKVGSSWQSSVHLKTCNKRTKPGSSMETSYQ